MVQYVESTRNYFYKLYKNGKKKEYRLNHIIT